MAQQAGGAFDNTARAVIGGLRGLVKETSDAMQVRLELRGWHRPRELMPEV